MLASAFTFYRGNAGSWPPTSRPLRPQGFGRSCGDAHLSNFGGFAALAAYLGGGSTFDEAIDRFAAAYADQNELDFDSLRQAVRDGRIEAHQEVQ